MQRQTTPHGSNTGSRAGRGGLRRSGLPLAAAVTACLVTLVGCAGQSPRYPGVPQPAYSQVDYFQPGQEEELKAEAARLRQAAQLPLYEEEATAKR